MSIDGGRFDFDDGGSYVGEWSEGRAHGLGLATGPNNQGEYSGEWSLGFESCGVYVWPNGSVFAGSWVKGKRHGEGVQEKGHFVYKGAFTTGYCGRYGTQESLVSCAKYEGSWHLNLFDGFGVQTSANGSSYAGSWSKGMRQGPGVRRSAPYGHLMEQLRSGTNHPASSSQTSLPSTDGSDRPTAGLAMADDNAGFVLQGRSVPVGHGGPAGVGDTGDLDKPRRSSLRRALMQRFRRQRSTGDLSSSSHGSRAGGSLRSTLSSQSQLVGQAMSTHHGHQQGANVPLDPPPADASVYETYSGQWNEDRRSGYGVSERTDGLRYEGEWFDNKKDGFGITHFPDRSVEEGRYKANVLVTALNRRNKLSLLRNSRLRECVDDAARRAREAAKEAQERAAETANMRAQSARTVSATAETRAVEARRLSTEARRVAKLLAPDFVQPGTEWVQNRQLGQSASAPFLSSRSHPSHPLPPSSILRGHQNQQGVARPQHDPHVPNTVAALHMANVAASTESVITRQRRVPLLRNQRSNENQDAGYCSQERDSVPDSAAVHDQDGEHEPISDDLLPPSLMTDHFDQYVTRHPLTGRCKRDSGLGRDNSLEENQQHLQQQGTSGGGSDTPDSGMSDVSQLSSLSAGTVPGATRGNRRRTLPSLIGQVPVPPHVTSSVVSSMRGSAQGPVRTGGGNPHSQSSNRMDNPRRRRLLPRVPTVVDDDDGVNTVGDAEQEVEDEEVGELPPLPPTSHRHHVSAHQGSLPNVSEWGVVARERGLMSRAEATRLGQARRQELLREVELRRQDEIVIRVADVSDWVHDNFLVILVFVINASLAGLFIALLVTPNRNAPS